MRIIPFEKELTTALSKRKTNLLYTSFCAFIAGFALIGWLFNIEFFKRPIAGLVAMNPLTAIFFLGLSFALYAKIQKRDKNIFSILSNTVAFAVLLLSSAKLTGDLMGQNLGIDTFFFHDSLQTDLAGNISNRMAPNTALAFILSSLGVLTLHFKFKNNKIPSQFIALLVATVGLLSVLGYLYELKSRAGFLAFMPMAIHSAIGFIFLAFAILFTHKNEGFMQDIMSDLIGATVLRKLIPAVIIIPIILGYLRLFASSKIHLPIELGVEFLILSIIVCSLVFIWYTARLLNNKHIQLNVAQEQLLEYKHFFENTNDFACIANKEGYLELLNPNFSEKLGFTHGKLTSNPFVDFIHPDDLASTMETYESQIEGAEVISFANRYRKKDGGYLWLDWNAVTNKETGKLYCVARDITEQKRVSEELVESNIFLDAIIENIPNMIFVKDVNDLKFVRFNKAGEELLGYKREDLIGKNDFDFFPKEQAEQFKSIDYKILKEGIVEVIDEEKIETSNGERWLRTKKIPVKDKQGNPIFLLGISEDITERKKAKEKLLEYKHFFHNSKDLAVILNMDGSIDTLNDNFSKFLGYTDEELYANHLISIMHPLDKKETINKLESLVEGISALNFEFRLRKKNGEYRWFEVNSTPNIQSSKIYAIMRDITYRKYNEDLLLKQSQSLKLANDELETFSYSVSHDLRAPLRSLEGFSKALSAKYEGKLDEDADRWLKFIESNARRMSTLINDMLAFSKITRTELEKSNMDMKAIVQDVFDFETQNYPNHTVQFNLGELPDVNGDRAMIRQVWQNLVSNALKYSSKKKEIKINVNCVTEDDMHTFSIEDNGAGFDERYKEKLFVVFQRLHSNTDFEGTGVGLAIANRIIRKHRGEMDAVSEIEKGSKFTFTLPKH